MAIIKKVMDAFRFGKLAKAFQNGKEAFVVKGEVLGYYHCRIVPCGQCEVLVCTPVTDEWHRGFVTTEITATYLGNNGAYYVVTQNSTYTLWQSEQAYREATGTQLAV